MTVHTVTFMLDTVEEGGGLPGETTTPVDLEQLPTSRLGGWAETSELLRRIGR